jgi:hypothetical protein
MNSQGVSLIQAFCWALDPVAFHSYVCYHLDHYTYDRMAQYGFLREELRRKMMLTTLVCSRSKQSSAEFEQDVLLHRMAFAWTH